MIDLANLSVSRLFSSKVNCKIKTCKKDDQVQLVVTEDISVINEMVSCEKGDTILEVLKDS